MGYAYTGQAFAYTLYDTRRVTEWDTLTLINSKLKCSYKAALKRGWSMDKDIYEPKY